MLTLGTQQTRTCGGVDRRGFLRLGGLTTMGLGLPQLLAAESVQPAASRKEVNCILLWMGGGASNIDTFDMKPDAPVEIRGEFRPIASKLSGLPVCEYLPSQYASNWPHVNSRFSSGSPPATFPTPPCKTGTATCCAKRL